MSCKCRFAAAAAAATDVTAMVIDVHREHVKRGNKGTEAGVLQWGYDEQNVHRFIMNSCQEASRAVVLVLLLPLLEAEMMMATLLRRMPKMKKMTTTPPSS